MDKKFKIAVIGSGGIGRRHVEAIMRHPALELIAVCDKNPEVLEEAPEITAKYTEAEEMLKAHELDLLSIILPNFLYEPMVALAAKYNVNVLCEKPLGQSLESCRNIISSIDKKGLKGWVSSQRKNLPHFVEARDIVKEMKPEFISSVFSYWWGAAFTDIGWRGDKSKGGGGTVIDSGWHVFDLLEWFTGTPEKVLASMSFMEKNPGIDDRASVLLKYPGGATANILMGFSLPLNTFEFTFAKEEKSLILGLGKYQYFENGEIVKEVKCEVEGKVFPFMFDEMYAELYKALTGEKNAYLTDFKRAENIMKVIDACYRSEESEKYICI